VKQNILRSLKIDSGWRPNPIRVIGIITFLVQIGSFYGEDIVNARENFLNGEKTDFWGGVSTLVYAHIPSIGFRWQIWLGIFQISLVTIGLEKLISIKKEKFLLMFPKLAATYAALLFGSQMTRDSLMFSLLVFGMAALKEKNAQETRPFLYLIPILLIILGMSFRPWLSIAIAPIIFLLLRNSQRKFSRTSKVCLILAITVTPILIEVTSAKILGLVKSYPEQQVMLMDSAASFCYTTNRSTGERAESALKLFSSDSQFSRTACQLFRPDTWLSLTEGGNTSSDGIDSNLSLLQVGDSERYEQLKTTWLKMSLLDPVTYLQNKMIFAGKLLIGSDSRGLSFLGENDIFSKALALYKIPYDIAISLHLFSLLSLSFVLFILPFKGYKKQDSRGVFLDYTSIYLFAAMMLWLGLSAIAYIGSNGRYTYTISLISAILLISSRTKHEVYGKINE
jgi:hypothetical protein